MAKLRLIKDLSNLDISLSSIATSFILGGSNIGKYIPTHLYMAGDKIISILNGNISIQECIKDNTTGSFNQDYWQKIASNLLDDTSTENPNTFQKLSSIDKKNIDDIDKIISILSASNSFDDINHFNSSITFPLITDDNVKIKSGSFQMGKIYI